MTIEAFKFKIDKMSPDEINKLVSVKCKEMKKLSNEILNKKWPTEENDMSIFKFIFEYNYFLKLYFFIEHNQTNEDYQEKESKIISLIESTLKHLTEGSVHVGLLKILNDKKTILIDLFKLFSKRIDSKPWDTDDQIEQVTNKVFAFRMKEIENFAQFYGFMNEFFTFMKSHNSFQKSI